jgi:hypothetical protein
MVGQSDDDDVRVRVVDGDGQVIGVLGDVPALAEGPCAAGAARIGDPDPIAAALAVQRVGVEVADEAGAEHGDGVAVHDPSLRALGCRRRSLGPAGRGLSDETAAA